MPNQAAYQIRLYDTAGALLDVIDTESGLRNFSLERRQNDYDILTLALDGTNATRNARFQLDRLIQILRKVDSPGASWYQEYLGFHRTPQDELTSLDKDIFTSYSRGVNDLLNRRAILYSANTAFTLKQGPGETVMKEFVNENAGPGAISPPRKRAGALSNFSVEASAGLGAVWGGATTWKNLLEVLKDISVQSGVDFNVELISGLTGWNPGTLTFEFRTFLPRDLTATVHFALQYGNMRDPSFTYSRTEEQNVILVLGQGEEDNRRTLVRASSAIADSPWNDIETTYDARSLETLAALQAAGDQQLEKLQAQRKFSFQPVQTDTLQYGQHYKVGDLVQASYKTVTATLKIIGTRINLNDGKEEITIEIGPIS